MSKTLSSFCQEFEDFHRKSREEPDKPWADPIGSLAKSLECGCRYCYIACAAVGRVNDVVQNKEKDLSTVLEDYALNFQYRGEVASTVSSKDELGSDFRCSGLKFENQGVSSEVFVLDGEIHNHDASGLPLTM